MKEAKPKNAVAVERPPASGPSRPESRLKKGFKIFLCLLIISAGLVAATYFNKTAPKARKRPPLKIVPRVEIQPLHPTSQRVVVTAMGIGVPSREIKLKTRVSGEVIFIHPEFIPGGFVKKGTVILKIDPEDYKLAVARKKSDVISGQYVLKLEMGHQDVAKREWELLNKNKPFKKNSDLALRKPHLAKAKGSLAAAEADLKQAKLNLKRTIVRAPFNAVVRTKNVELGSQVSSQEQLAELVGTDEYWVQAAIPVDRLKWIRIPRSQKGIGDPVRVIYRNVFERTGTVLKLLSDLEPEGRMARILISIKDPLDFKSPSSQKPPLLIGEYVRIEIQGKPLSDIYAVPRSALRDNTHLWLLTQTDQLEIRAVKTVWRGRDTILIREGLQPGDRLIVSELSKPVPGMSLKAHAQKPDTQSAPLKKEKRGKEHGTDTRK